MRDRLKNTIEILTDLVGFESISGSSTHEIIGYIESYLKRNGVKAILSFDKDGERANLFATIGPEIDGGIVLNGHTDVVPIQGQVWKTNPFTLTQIDDRLYGRGSVDMKGFLACVLGSISFFQTCNLQKPIHIAFSFDEETGGFGMPILLKSMAEMKFRPAIVIVGEPTEMKIITGHKGGDEMRTEIKGYEVHSCDPRKGVSAVSAAVQLISKIEEIGVRLSTVPIKDSLYEPPYGTFNVGTIEGGATRNATSGWCNFDWEFRPMPGEDRKKIITEIEDFARNELLPLMVSVNKNADIKVITEVSAPALDDRNADAAAEFISKITGQNSRGVVSFGTDAGYFSDAGFSSVVFGPGTIKRAHGPDEYITAGELKEGLKFLKDMADHLSD